MSFIPRLAHREAEGLDEKESRCCNRAGHACLQAAKEKRQFAPEDVRRALDGLPMRAEVSSDLAESRFASSFAPFSLRPNVISAFFFLFPGGTVHEGRLCEGGSSIWSYRTMHTTAHRRARRRPRDAAPLWLLGKRAPVFFLAGRDRQAAQRRLLFSPLPPRLLLLLTYARSSRVFRNAVSFARCLFCAAPTQGSEILTLAP